MEKIKQFKEFVELKNSFDVPHISFVNIYYSPDQFYDYIAKDDNYFYNFCKITDINRPRYEYLVELNKKLISKHYIPVTAIIKDGWYFEQIQIFSINYFTVPVDIKLLLTSVEQLNKDIRACPMDLDLINGHHHFMKYHYGNLTEIFGVSCPDVNFLDMEKTFELSRMLLDDGVFKFTGAQALLPGPAEYGTIAGILFSTYLDNDNEIFEKFKLINYKSSVVERIIYGIKDQADVHKHAYFMDSSALSAHFDKLGRLWKQLQLQASADL